MDECGSQRVNSHSSFDHMFSGNTCIPSKLYNITVLGRNNYHKIVMVFNSLNFKAFKLKCAYNLTTGCVNPYNAELILYKLWKPKGLFEFEIIINASVSSFQFISIPMLWVYDRWKYFISFSAGPSLCVRISRLQTADLTSKDGPRTGMVKY